MDNCADFNMVPSENGNRCECPRGFHFELDNSKLDLNIEKLRNRIPSDRPTSSTTGTANTAGTGKAATETANTAGTGRKLTEAAGDLLDYPPGGCVINSCPKPKFYFGGHCVLDCSEHLAFESPTNSVDVRACECKEHDEIVKL